MKRLFTLIAAGLVASVMQALTVPQIFSDNMMLQQDCDAKLWGWAEPGSSVLVRCSWNKLKRYVVAGEDGRWTATVHTPKGGYDTYSLTIQGDGEKREIKNVMVGEVWFCSGQSNMEMTLGGFWNCPTEGANEAIAQSGRYRRNIRVATVEHDGAQTPQKDVRCRWDECMPEKAAGFSACAYFFARTLTDLIDVPVGVINCSWGGSTVEGWMPEEVLRTYPDGLTPISNYKFHEKMIMYNGMLYPLSGYTVRGFLWNQGESNVGREKDYIERFKTMVGLWRQMWQQPGDPLPIYTVEIPPYWYDDVNGYGGAKLREAQHIIARELDHCGCVPTTDLSYPWEVKQIHPTQKRQIGERLAYMAATRDYGVKGLAAEAPEIEKVQLMNGGKKARLFFSNAQDGFDRLQDIEGFEVAGKDGQYHAAKAWASSAWEGVEKPGCFIEVESADVEVIESVQYCFRNYMPGRLHNTRGLPVVPFRKEGGN